jgi:hypothetical protein
MPLNQLLCLSTTMYVITELNDNKENNRGLFQRTLLVFFSEICRPDDEMKRRSTQRDSMALFPRRL